MSKMVKLYTNSGLVERGLLLSINPHTLLATVKWQKIAQPDEVVENVPRVGETTPITLEKRNRIVGWAP